MIQPAYMLSGVPTISDLRQECFSFKIGGGPEVNHLYLADLKTDLTIDGAALNYCYKVLVLIFASKVAKRCQFLSD